MEKYIDALKLGAKRKAEEKPVGLKKRKLAKGAKALEKITAEEYIAKVKAPPKAKIRKQKSKKLTDTELLQKLQLQKELKQRKEKLKKEKEKIATQSETAKEKEKIEKEKESQNLERVRLALFPKEKETTAPISLLDTDLQFRKLSAADRKLVKEVLKSKGNKKQQLEAVKKFIELPKAEKESFLTNELSGETKGTITELKESDEPEPVSKKTKASKKQKKTLKQQRTNQIEERYDEIDGRVKAINELFSKGNIELNSYLNKKWDNEQLPNIYESLNKDIEYFITTEEIEKITTEYIKQYELDNIPSDVSEKTKGKKAKGKKANQDKLDDVLERVNASIDLYGQGNQDREIFLQRKWSNFIPRLEQDIKNNIEITNDDINNKTEEFLEEYDRTFDLDVPQDVKAKLPKPAPQPEAFIPAKELKKGQEQIDKDEEETLEKAFQASKAEVEIPDSALEAIDRVNTQNAKEGKAINVLEGKTAKTAITKKKSGRPSKEKAPAPAPAPSLASTTLTADEKKDLLAQYDKDFPSQSQSKRLQDIYNMNFNLEKFYKDYPQYASASAPAPTPAHEPLIAITPTQSETDKDIAQIAQATVEADPTIAPADQDATASAIAEGFASGLKKVKKMHGKIIHDKVVKVMASQAGIQKGLNKVKKMHGGAMHDRVKGMLMKKFPSFFFLRGGSIDKSPADNTDVFFSDYSDFVLSDFYKNNKSIITKYPAQKKVFEYVPPYKAYRIVIRPTSQNIMGNKIVYTIDSDKFTYDDDLQELYKLGGISSDDYFGSRKSQAKQELSERKKISDTSLISGYKKGYSRGYQQKEQEQEEEKEKEDNSPFHAFVKGFTAPISLVKEFI